MKTYGTYKDCAGADAPIDQYRMHELLDRVHMLHIMFGDFIEDHPAATLVQEDVQEIGRLLSGLYQKVGRIEFNGG
jgi:hypothetical protein